MDPGAVYPGIVGAICLLVGLYAFAALPMNYAGLALLMLGIGLMVAELCTPSLGILGIGGVIAFVLGAAILLDTDMPQFRLAWPVISGLAVVSLGMVLFAGRLSLSTRGWRGGCGRDERVRS